MSDEQREVGVGPHPEPWPDDPRLDPALLAEGDRRNVVDRYRYWRARRDRRRPRHPPPPVPRRGRELGARPQHRDRRAQRERVPGRRGAHRRPPPLEPPRRDGHRPLPARPPPRDARGVRGVGGRARAAGDRRSTTCRAREPIDAYPLPERCALLFGQEGPGLSTRRASWRSRCSRSASSARPARSTRPPRRRSRCTSGSGGTRRRDEHDAGELDPGGRLVGGRSLARAGADRVDDRLGLRSHDRRERPGERGRAAPPLVERGGVQRHRERR